LTAIVHDADKLRELDDGARQAWKAYSDQLRDLTGAEYERAESQSWDDLQRELRRLERQRKTLTRTRPELPAR
jgi:cell division septum initiation protein DivIVA